MIKLKFFGLGGQGIVTAAKVLSAAVSLHENKYAITVPSYGAERRGAPVYTSIIIDEQPVLLNCFVYEPDIVLATDDSLMDRNINIGEGIPENAVLVINTKSLDNARMHKARFGFSQVYYVNATEIAVKSIGRTITNSSMLGAIAKTGLVNIESVEKALIETFGEKGGAANAKAAREAYERCAVM